MAALLRLILMAALLLAFFSGLLALLTGLLVLVVALLATVAGLLVLLAALIALAALLSALVVLSCHDCLNSVGLFPLKQRCASRIVPRVLITDLGQFVPCRTINVRLRSANAT